jgi:hypothetical protein
VADELPGPGGPDGSIDTEAAAGRQPGWPEVVVVGAVVVALVLVAAALTAILPPEAQGVVFHTPLLIAVLIVGTAIVLWRILRAPGR